MSQTADKFDTFRKWFQGVVLFKIRYLYYTYIDNILRYPEIHPLKRQSVHRNQNCIWCQDVQ